MSCGLTRIALRIKFGIAIMIHRWKAKVISPWICPHCCIWCAYIGQCYESMLLEEGKIDEWPFENPFEK